MNRRGFLGFLGVGATAIIVPELLVPKRTFFLPPAGGWHETARMRYVKQYSLEATGDLWQFSMLGAKPNGEETQHVMYTDTNSPPMYEHVRGILARSIQKEGFTPVSVAKNFSLSLPHACTAAGYV